LVFSLSEKTQYYSHSAKPKFKVVKLSTTRMPASIDDDGAEEDEEQITARPCGPPQVCKGLLEKTGEELNPIARAFASYSSSEMVTELIRIAREQIAVNPDRYIVRRANGRVQTYCYGAVKDALRGSGMVPADFTGGRFAYNAVVDLAVPEAGFKNLLDMPRRGEPNYEAKLAVSSMLQNNPSMAPPGSILVYRTVNGARRSNGRPVDPAGHTEIKIGAVGEDLYISVSEKDVPTYGYSLVTQRTLVGVMYLPRLLSPDSIYYQGQILF
jgi:hypothetical protein